MSLNRTFKALAALVCLTLLTPLQASAQQRVHCESKNYRYKYCRAQTDNRARLVRQRSNTRCRLWDNWGYDRHGVWVDRGCEADFEVGRGGRYDYDDRYDRDRDDGVNKGAAIAAGAVASAAIIAAIAAHKHKDNDEVDSWAVGTFSGYDEAERTDVTLTILPGGSVTGRAGLNKFTGRMEGDKLQAGRQTFKVKRSGNGFIATDERNSSHRVVFRLTGSGYSGSGY
jgi:Protein of unknown function (DUF3011)